MSDPNDNDLTPEEARDIAAEAKHGKPTRFLEKTRKSSPVIDLAIETGQLKVIHSNQLHKELERELGPDEQERTRRLHEQLKDWRKCAERVCIALLNKRALEDTVQGWQDKYDETQEHVKSMQNLLGNFQSELENQKSTMVNALDVKYGNGPTVSAVSEPDGDANSCVR